MLWVSLSDILFGVHGDAAIQGAAIVGSQIGLTCTYFMRRIITQKEGVPGAEATKVRTTWGCCWNQGY